MELVSLLRACIDNIKVQLLLLSTLANNTNIRQNP